MVAQAQIGISWTVQEDHAEWPLIRKEVIYKQYHVVLWRTSLCWMTCSLSKEIFLGLEISISSFRTTNFLIQLLVKQWNVAHRCWLWKVSTSNSTQTFTRKKAGLPLHRPSEWYNFTHTMQTLGLTLVWCNLCKMHDFFLITKQLTHVIIDLLLFLIRNKKKKEATKKSPARRTSEDILHEDTKGMLKPEVLRKSEDLIYCDLDKDKQILRRNASAESLEIASMIRDTVIWHLFTSTARFYSIIRDRR